MSADRFKDVCLKALDEVAATREAVVITMRGKPVAQLVPYVAPDRSRNLAGSILRESGDLYATSELWDAEFDQIRTDW